MMDMTHQNEQTEQVDQHDQHDQSAVEQVTVICPHCASEITELDHLCPNCGGPVTAHAMIDPMSRIYSMGFCARRFSPDTTKPIFILGMWMLLIPSTIFVGIVMLLSMDELMQMYGMGFLGSSTLQVSGDSIFKILVQLFFFTAIFFWNTHILLKMTRAAIRRRKQVVFDN